jgi:hypothetical protein
MHLGIDVASGLVYEGLSAPEMPSIPLPSVTQAKLIQTESDWQNLPSGLSGSPFAWVFREDSFDPVTRTRRGRLYEPNTGSGASQPSDKRVGPHPYEDPMMRAVGREGRVMKSMNTFIACNSLLMLPAQGQGLTLALGTQRAASGWRILQTEVLVNGCVMVTLKALSAFGILPAVDYAKIDAPFQPAAREAIERVLNSAFRESATSVIDHCRAALTVLLSRWLVQEGHEDAKALGTDLGALAKKVEVHGKDCVAKAAAIVARLHVRGKPNEQHARGLRPPEDGDAELALHAVGIALRDFGWAT